MFVDGRNRVAHADTIESGGVVVCVDSWLCGAIFHVVWGWFGCVSVFNVCCSFEESFNISALEVDESLEDCLCNTFSIPFFLWCRCRNEEFEVD